MSEEEKRREEKRREEKRREEKKREEGVSLVIGFFNVVSPSLRNELFLAKEYMKLFDLTPIVRII
jgi:hypothetical protein